jgi:hypothetical protein
MSTSSTPADDVALQSEPIRGDGLHPVVLIVAGLRVVDLAALDGHVATAGEILEPKTAVPVRADRAGDVDVADMEVLGASPEVQPGDLDALARGGDHEHRLRAVPLDVLARVAATVDDDRLSRDRLLDRCGDRLTPCLAADACPPRPSAKGRQLGSSG